MYETHIARAARYAAVVLTERPQGTADRDTLQVLQEDLALTLAETTRLVTGLVPQRPRATRVSDLAFHPVRVMLNHLNGLGHPEPSPGDRPPPSLRWAGRPQSPAAVTDPRSAWQGLVVETFLARHALEQDERPLTPARRWAVMGDVAALVETLAIGQDDLFVRAPTEETYGLHVRGVLASLAVEAREVARLAATAGADPDRAMPGTTRARGVVTVPRSSRLPDAVQNLAHILAHEETSAPDLLAVARVLVQTSRAIAEVLTAAAKAPQVGIPDELSATAAALTGHADHLAEAVTAHQTRLGSTTPGSPLLIAQAREIGAIAVPGLRSLARRPADAEAASPDLLRYAEVVPAVTEAVRAAFTDLDDRRRILLRDRSDYATRGWRRTWPGDLHELTTELREAAAAARTAPPPIQTRPTPTVPAATIAAGAAVLDLQAALLRRQSKVHPHRPATPAVDRRYPTHRAPTPPL